MENRIFENYDVFYNMVLSTTIMSNSQSEKFVVDSEKIIDFIGNAYNLDEDFISQCKQTILGDLMSLNLFKEQLAIYASRNIEEELSDSEALFDIKGEVLTRLHSMSNLKSPEINSNWFDYSHYKTYQAEVRFKKLNATSSTGNIIATRQVGILSALGIGCEVDYVRAIKRLSQCAYWGDIPAIYMLAYTYKLAGFENESNTFYELASLADKYLFSGYTVLPEEDKKKYSEQACLYYVYISTIKQDIVHAYNKSNIDFSFLEALTSPTIDHFERMEYINDYEKKEWKNITNSSEKPTKKFGFR